MIHSFTWLTERGMSVGKVVRQSDAVIRIIGLKEVFVGESLVSKSGVIGVVIWANEKEVCAYHFSNFDFVVGEEFVCTGEYLSISVGEKMLGHSFDSLGYTYGGKDDSNRSENRSVFGTKTDLETRGMVKDFLPTGVATLDLLVPLAKGQRELIIGDMGVGKSCLARQILSNHIRSGGVGVMCLVGKSRTEIDDTMYYMEKQGVSFGCVFVVEPSDAVSSKIQLAPLSAMSIAEFFRDLGRDVLVVFDDMTIHARKSRELSLMAKNFPGRESYPIDIFGTHASLLERAGCFLIDKKMSASITCLPIAETMDGNISGYIETNLMSMTDGHIYMDKNIYLDGVLPAVNRNLSVTRVGRQVQPGDMKTYGNEVGKSLNDFDNLRNFLKFGYEMNEDANKKIEINKKIMQILVQEETSFFETADLISKVKKIFDK